MLRSTHPKDLSLLVWRTTSRFWRPHFKRRESELTLSLFLTLKNQMHHCTLIMQQTVQCSRCHGLSLCNITLLTHVEYILPLQGADCGGEKGQQLVELAPSTFAACYSSQLTTISTFTPFTVLQSIGRAVLRHRAHLKSGLGRKGSLILFLVYPAQTTTT